MGRMDEEERHQALVSIRLSFSSSPFQQSREERKANAKNGYSVPCTMYHVQCTMYNVYNLRTYGHRGLLDARLPQKQGQVKEKKESNDN